MLQLRNSRITLATDHHVDGMPYETAFLTAITLSPPFFSNYRLFRDALTCRDNDKAHLCRGYTFGASARFILLGEIIVGTLSAIPRDDSSGFTTYL